MIDLAELRDTVRDRLSRGDVEGAWAAWPPVAEVIAAGAEASLSWLETARIAPAFSAQELLGHVIEIDDAFTDEAEVSIAVCATLIATVSRRPIDTPRVGDDLAARALIIAERLAGADVSDALRPFATIQLANALRLSTRDRDDDAQRAFDAAIAARPDEASFHFDLGLFHKSRGRFAEAYEAFARARDLGRRDKPLAFNLAVAATALGRGADARRAWADLGISIDVNTAGMPEALGLDPVELRVPTRGSGHGAVPAVPDEAMSFEVVSVAPLSPCHGVVQTPTLRDAPVDYGDVVLWDGVPVGRRGAVPRFALLEILRRGDERRYRFVALEQSEGDVQKLAAALPEGSALFVLDARAHAICPRCAAGDALVKHDHDPPEEHRIVYGKLIATADVDLASLAGALERALTAKGAVSLAVPELYDGLGDAKRAGREHQAFRGIEQVALRKGLTGAR